MATEFIDAALVQVREVIARLQAPVPDLPTLLALLATPLDRLGLLPPQFRKHNVNPLPDGSIIISKHIPTLQRALLEHIIPTWQEALEEGRYTLLIEQYFCPDTFSFASPSAGAVTVLAYSSILSHPLTDYGIRLLARLSKEYPVDRLHAALFSARVSGSNSKLEITWEDCIRDICSVPAKVANATLAGKGEIPLPLENRSYFDHVSLRCEILISSMATNRSRDAIPSITYLLTKLVNVGVFPPTNPMSLSQPSYFQTTLPAIRRKIEDNAYSAYWSEIISSFPSTFTLQAIITSLLGSLSTVSSGLDSSLRSRALVKREASILRRIIGPLKAQNQELWEVVSGIILGGREWEESYARIFVCWVAGPDSDQSLECFLTSIVETWSSPEHIKHSLLSRHRYVTCLLLVAVSYFSQSSPQLQSLALSPIFISGVGTYISHLDGSVRRCGMLAAEIVAQRTGKKLDFGDWEGEGGGKEWSREMRQLILERDVDADLVAHATEAEPSEYDVVEEIFTDATRHSHSANAPSWPPSSEPNTTPGYDSDDSLTGYASPTSSRSASPTPSELDEIEKDPTLGVGSKKIPRPVYLAQLGEMIRGTAGAKTTDTNEEVSKLEMALDCAAELIRRKKDYGTELDENAVNLAYGLIGLQDNYDLEGFEEKRQSALNALVASSPRKAAPSLIEEFFKNQYSTDQRFVILNALALGVREMASLPVPTSAGLTSFPSKQLPPALHQKYLAAGNQTNDVVGQMLEDISRRAIDRTKDSNADKVPELVRERNLRIRKPAKITEIAQSSNTILGPHLSSFTKSTTFTEVAAEFFIAPLINRFWLFLRDEQTREERTAHHEGRQQYHGAGTGLILNPLVLSRFLSTLAILVHTARNATEWLAVIGPDALELAVTLGTRPVSWMESELDDDDDITSTTLDSARPRGKDASVLSSALELALVVLDCSLVIDNGRALGLEHTALLLGAGEWAGSVFSKLDKGARMEGGGGAQEVKLRRAAAGVLLKVDELTSQWRRSMVDTR